MEFKRIRKLLQCAEYIDFAEDDVLVESPFAETTRDGEGIREVALALTRTKLIVAADTFPQQHEFYCVRETDSSIETLELISVYPLEFLTISVYRRKQRKVLKTRFVDGRAKYFELGGISQRSKYWIFWCKHVHKLWEREGASGSKTEAAERFAYGDTSSERPKCNKGAACRRLGQKLRLSGGGSGDATCSHHWNQKNLFLGPSYQELEDGHYKPIPLNFATADMEEIKDALFDVQWKSRTSKNTLKAWLSDSFSKKDHDSAAYSCDTIERDNSNCEISEISTRSSSFQYWIDKKFQSTIYEFWKNHCCKDFDSVKSGSARSTSNSWATTSASMVTSSIKSNCRHKRQRGGADAVLMDLVKKLSWLSSQRYVNSSGVSIGLKKSSLTSELIEDCVSLWENSERSSQARSFKKRKYGISTSTYFLQGFGPWSVQPGDRISTPRRACSCVSIRRLPTDPELQLPLSRRQLAKSISLTNLSSGRIMKPSTTMRGRLVLFWTPDYWYRPRAAAVAYRETRRHLQRLQEFKAIKNKNKSSCSFYGRKNTKCPLDKIFSNPQQHRPTSPLRRLLELKTQVSLWELNSTTLAQQLTLVDRELFLRLPAQELYAIARNKTSRDAPNFAAWVAFAHRVSCLVASEILAEKKIRARARLIGRLIIVAWRCFDIGNFQSARSVLAGLQSPGIYRLRDTWDYVKNHYTTRYWTMEMLCKVFKSTTTVKYKNAWRTAEKNPPSIPYVADVLTRILTHESRRSSFATTSEPKKPLPRYRNKRRSVSTRLNNFTGSFRKDSIEKRLIEEQNSLCHVMNWLEYCQKHAQDYNFPTDSIAWEFLLKARYNEEQDNFFQSSKLETPQQYL